jgi:hypothetical protein
LTGWLERGQPSLRVFAVDMDEFNSLLITSPSFASSRAIIPPFAIAVELLRAVSYGLPQRAYD